MNFSQSLSKRRTEPVDDFYIDLFRKEEDGSRTRLRHERISSRGVLRILAKYFRERLHTSAISSSGRGRRRGRPARKDVTKAFQLIQQGVPQKEIYELLHIVPAARHAFRQALWLRKRHQERRAQRKKTAYSTD